MAAADASHVSVCNGDEAIRVEREVQRLVVFCWLRLDGFVFWKGNFALTQVAFIRSLGECQVLSCKMN